MVKFDNFALVSGRGTISSACANQTNHRYHVVYHIHGLPVPADGNCSATLGHLDPTDRGELHACEVAAPQTCQAGDLAGKHGNITSTSFTAR